MPTDYFANPFRIDSRGGTARVPRDVQIRDLIYQVLFTAPGERVNRPDFGCGVRQLLFMGNSDALAATTQFLVQASLQKWLGDLIEIDRVEVTNDAERLIVEVVYTRRDNRQRENVNFVSPTEGR